MAKVRKSNLELLRILSIIMIIFHHFSVHSGFYFPSNIISINELWCHFIEIGGKIGVDIFIVISGYFLINSDKAKIGKILKLILQVLFYSLTIYVLLAVVGVHKFMMQEFIFVIFPITYRQYWFFSTYFVLYLLHPFINKLLANLQKNEYKKLLLLLFVMWSIVPSFLGQDLQSNDLLWFMFVYALGGYIRLHENFEKIDNKKMMALTMIFIIIKFLIILFWDIVCAKRIVVWKDRYYFYHMNNVLTLLIAVSLFLVFKNIHIKDNKVINIISSATFGIYLIHDNSFLRPILWENLFQCSLFSESKMFIIYSIGICLIVFFSCLVIELIRIYLLERKYMKLIDKIEPRIELLLKENIDIT